MIHILQQNGQPFYLKLPDGYILQLQWDGAVGTKFNFGPPEKFNLPTAIKKGDPTLETTPH